MEPIYLYILSLLPVRRLEIFESWRQDGGSFENIYRAPDKKLAEFGLGLELIIKLRQIKAEHSPEQIALALEQTRVSTLPYYDPRYPKLLKEIYDAPPVLFYRGLIGDPDEACLAIVGSRNMSAYGSAMMPRITTPLINAGVIIVSGMALGIDSAAHIESVKRGARTIAVLGGGVDETSVYPRAHYRLSEQILLNNGLLISEQPPFTPALRYNFIARNRIIAGLSLGVIIVECKLKSGALITADYAADFNRALYAVPGPAYSSLSEGPHMLIKNGAALVTNGSEILEDLSLSLGNDNQTIEDEQNISLHQLMKNQSVFTEAEQRVLECMQSTPVTVDAITKATNLSAIEISQIITTLELHGAIKNIGPEGFMKI